MDKGSTPKFLRVSSLLVFMSSAGGQGRFVYLDVDISSSFERFKRAVEFVEANDLKYNFSSKELLQLGGRELQSVEDFYHLDFDWKQRGPILLHPQEACRVVIRLLDGCPLACDNFEALCNGSKGKAKSSGVPLHYKGVKFHRIVPNFIIQGGDIVMQNGSGGESIYGKKFKDEKAGLARKHNKAGIVSMCNSGKNSNTSQFFITLNSSGSPQCDGKHVVFGEVVSGLEVLEAIEKGVQERGGDEEDSQAVIFDCGSWDDSMLKQGYWAPNYTFLPVPVKKANESLVKNMNSNHGVVDAAKRKLVDFVESLSIPNCKKQHQSQRVPLVIVIAPKEVALEKFNKFLDQLSDVAELVYTIDIEGAVQTIRNCFHFEGVSDTADSTKYRALAGVVLGHSLDETEQTRVCSACEDGSYNIHPVVCKPAEAIEKLAACKHLEANI